MEGEKNLETNTSQGEAPRKRRNRWDDSDSVSTEKKETLIMPNPEIQVSNDLKDEENPRKSRKSRWGSASEAQVVPICLPVSSTNSMAPVQDERVMQQILALELQLKLLNQKLLTVARDALLIEQDPNRSPSPPPKYDSNGKRTNTRDVRMREAINAERFSIIEQLIKLNPHFQPPLDYAKSKPFRRIYIPKTNDPTFNYIGIIIGPRGNTQKLMEQETGCKISIRGKGSAKEGSKGRANKNIDEDEDLHVHVSGDDEERVEKAAKMIEALLRPADDSLAEHKQKQLRELALINGTLRENEYCPVCGEKGHQQFDCPYRAKAFKAAGVKCSICGDLSHPTRDCPLKQEAPQNEKALDSEYDSFLAELGGGSKPSSNNNLSTESGVNSNISVASKVLKPNGPTILAPVVDILSRTTTIPIVSNPSVVPPVISTNSIPPLPTPPTLPPLPAMPHTLPSGMAYPYPMDSQYTTYPTPTAYPQQMYPPNYPYYGMDMNAVYSMYSSYSANQPNTTDSGTSNQSNQIQNPQ